MLSQERINEILLESGAKLEGHFMLTSGLHSGTYMQCAKLFQNTKYSEELCCELAEKYRDDNIELVVGPAMGAVLMAYEVSRHLGVPNFFTERVDGKMQLRRGFSVTKGQRVLVTEDVVTTGGSVKEVIELLEGLGATVVSVGSIVDRSGGRADFGVPFKSVISINVEAYKPEECPLCKMGIEAYKPGSRNLK